MLLDVFRGYSDSFYSISESGIQRVEICDVIDVKTRHNAYRTIFTAFSSPVDFARQTKTAKEGLKGSSHGLIYFDRATIDIYFGRATIDNP